MIDATQNFPSSPGAAHPALIGTAVPDTPLVTDTGVATTLSAAVAGEPTVLVFYRGGW
jgi:hypothetical protein